MKNAFKVLVIHVLFVGAVFAQEALFSANSTGVAVSTLYASGKDYKSKSFAALLLHKGKFFIGYEHDAVQLWVSEEYGYYSYKIKQSWDSFYLGFRNFEKPERKQIFSFTFQIGYAFSSSDYNSTIRAIPLAVTLFKQLSNQRVKLVPLIYATYAYFFSKYNSEWTSTRVSTDYSYGFQLNAVFRPLSSLNHGIGLGLDFNLKNRNVPLALQLSLVFNAFKSD